MEEKKKKERKKEKSRIQVKKSRRGRETVWVGEEKGRCRRKCWKSMRKSNTIALDWVRLGHCPLPWSI